MRKAVFLILLIFSASTATTFTKVIGNTSLFSVKIIVNDNDTTVNKNFDSLCCRYEFLPLYNKFIYHSYDFRFQIYKKAGVPGNLIISYDKQYWSNSKDTLSCDSLGFISETVIDTVKSDSASLDWDYPRPVKRIELSNPYLLYQSNHIKFKIKSTSVNDSMVFTRENVKWQNVKYGTYKSLLNSPKFPSSGNQVQFFDLRGVKLKELRKQSIAVVFDKNISKTQLMFVR